ncbi:MAG: hypothetical protein ACI92B_001470 [Marinobacter maritimus]|jgi:hypothetical protein
MALVKCKECGSEVSTKAKICPKCGAKAPKKTSMFTWVVAAIMVIALFNVFNSEPSRTSASSASSSNQGTSSSTSGGTTTRSSEPVAVKAPEWSTFDSADEMTGKKSAYAVSPKATTTKPMSFPYNNAEARLAVGCDATSEWAYMIFTDAPNLNDGDIEDGYKTFRVRVRWDENVVTERLTQDWGAKVMHFQDKASVIQKIGGAASVMVELNWHSQGAVRFPFSLNGSSKAIQEIRGKCAGY